MIQAASSAAGIAIVTGPTTATAKAALATSFFAAVIVTTAPATAFTAGVPAYATISSINAAAITPRSISAHTTAAATVVVAAAAIGAVTANGLMPA